MHILKVVPEVGSETSLGKISTSPDERNPSVVFVKPAWYEDKDAHVVRSISKTMEEKYVRC